MPFNFVARHLFWNLVVTGATIFLGVEVPLRLALKVEIPGDASIYWMATAVLVIDVLLRGRSAERKLTSWLLVDLISAIPFRILPGGSVLDLFRIVKLIRVNQWIHDWQQNFLKNAVILQVSIFVFRLLFLAHLLACGWLGLGGIERQPDTLTYYVHSVYWCITTLTTVGYGDIVPATNLQMCYAMFVMLSGVGIYGFVIGNIANLLANLDAPKRHYLEAMERLGVFLNYRQIPPPLQRRLRNYYTYRWKNQMGYDEASVLDDLPYGLRTEVAVYLRRNLIEGAPLFKDASQELVRELALQLIPLVFTPGDYIFQHSRAGRHMYFIGRGRVEILDPGTDAVLAELGAGAFFGEMALLFTQPRTASVRAIDYCDLYSLDKESFDGILARYPEFATHIRDEANRRNAR